MTLSENKILPLDEVVGDQRPLDPEPNKLAGVLSALHDYGGLLVGASVQCGAPGPLFTVSNSGSRR
jgi:hypothetical protein